MALFGKAKRVVVHPCLGEVAFHRRRGSKNIRLSVSTSGRVLLSYPWHISFSQAYAFLEQHQEWAMSTLERTRQRCQQQKTLSLQEVEELRLKAKRTLLPRLELLARMHQFSYRKSFIKNNRTNWGSCSGVNNINLNLRIVLLPDHLRDYVLLHELCHTRIKNHGPQFWALLNSVTAGNAKIYAKELRTQQRLKDFHRNP